MHIRKATAVDAPIVEALIEEVYVGGGWADPVRSPEYVRSLRDAAGRIARADVLLAELDGDPVATITATEQRPLANIVRPGELEVRMLGVLSRARRRGVAAALMAHCEELGRQRGLQRVVLSTEPGMSAAQRLYEGLGYQRTPERDWPIGGITLLTYAKDL